MKVMNTLITICYMIVLDDPPIDNPSYMCVLQLTKKLKTQRKFFLSYTDTPNNESQLSENSQWTKCRV